MTSDATSASTVAPDWAGHRFLAALALVGLLTVAAYARALSGEFQLDDQAAVVENVRLRDLGGLLSGRLLEASRPVTELSFALDFAAAGLDVRAFHLSSLLAHLATAALLAFLARRLLRRLGWPAADGLALFVAGLFALHPLQSQAVSYVSQRAEVLASLFMLAALWLLLSAEEARPPGRRAWARLGGAVLATLLALGSKPIAVTLPAAYLLLSWLFPAPSRDAALVGWRTRLALAAPVAALAAAAAALQLGSLGAAVGAGFDLPALGPGRYALTQLAVLVRYLGLLLWPAGQNLDHAFPLSDGLGEPRTLLAGALLLALAAAAAAALRWSFGPAGGPAPRAVPGQAPGQAEARRAARLAGFGVAWFFLLLAPTSSAVPLADVIAEHRVYLAAFGPILAVGAGASLALRGLARRGGPSPPGAGALLALAAWVAAGLALHQRNEVWTSRLAMWRDVVAKSPGKARAHENLGHALYLAGDHRGAAISYSAALVRAGDGSVPSAKLVANVGASLLEFGRIPEAIRYLADGLRAAPDDRRLLGNLAIAYLQAGDLAAAEETARRAVAVWPRDPGAHQALGLVLAQRGDGAGAARELAAAAALDPDLPLQTREAALAEERAGRPAPACAAWRQYLAMRPGPAGEAEARGRMRAMGCGP